MPPLLNAANSAIAAACTRAISAVRYFLFLSAMSIITTASSANTPAAAYTTA